MTQEVLEYNRKCAKLIGGVYSELAKAWGFGDAKNIGSKMFRGVMYHNVIEARKFRFEKDLKFHSSWNRIMEVVETIEKLGFVFNIYHQDCLIEKDKKFIVMTHATKLKTKKEAVVQAINQFLIWYDEQNS